MGNRGSKKKEESMIKIVVLGDGAVGKTCLSRRCCGHEFPSDWVPTVHEVTEIKDRDYGPFSLFDTGGGEGYTRIRRFSYPKTDCFLLCFSVENIITFYNLEDFWIPEVRKSGPKKARAILVGLKTDLREDKELLKDLEKIGRSFVSLETAQKLGEGVEDIFRAATLAPPALNMGPKHALS